MGKEIERKFLVNSSGFKALAFKKIHIMQGYLNREPERTVRIRIIGNQGMLTIKGMTIGCVREEFEYEIPIEDAISMLKLCKGRIIDKTRWLIKASDGHIWEVDEFHGELHPLIVAEIELSNPDENFDHPFYIGKEVTGDTKYYNSTL